MPEPTRTLTTAQAIIAFLIQQYVDYTAANRMLLFLDYQFGLHPFEDELDAFEEWISYEHVHLALDPDDLQPGLGQLPGEVLAAHSEGIVCLAACLSGEVALYLRQGKYEEARAHFEESRALEIARRSLGERHYEIAGYLNDLGTMDLLVGALSFSGCGWFRCLLMTMVSVGRVMTVRRR